MRTAHDGSSVYTITFIKPQLHKRNRWINEEKTITAKSKYKTNKARLKAECVSLYYKKLFGGRGWGCCWEKSTTGLIFPS